MIFAVLEVHIGWARLLACVVASHILPTVTVALLAPLLGHADMLSEVDYGTSCLVVGAVAGLAWLRATAPESAVRSPDEAVRLAERAAELTSRRDAGALDVLAAAYASESSEATNVVEIPSRRSVTSSSVCVPPYSCALATT